MVGVRLGAPDQATIGTAIEFGSFVFSLDGGYKFPWNVVDEVAITTSSGDRKKYEPWDIGCLSRIIT
jgi:hypothetical protein